MKDKAAQERREVRKKLRKSLWSGLPLLLALVLFVFFVLLVSVLLVVLLYGLLAHYELIPVEIANDSLLNSSFILGIALAFGTSLSVLVGYYSLRPMKKFINATKEIAEGNFNITLRIKGPREILKLAESFNEMAKELSSIETLRSDFVSNISHEFKTPVVSIRGFAKLLQKNNLSAEEKKEYLDIIISESERLSTLSSNVLLLSRLDSIASLETAPIRLDEQLRRAILLLQPQIARKNLDVDIDLQPIVIPANDELLQHVWINLLNNAVKFSQEQGTISVYLSREKAEAKVIIRDTGIGMDADALRHIFDKFYQQDSSRATEGNGLGLSLVRRILDLSGGRIEVCSEPGKGSTFTVYLTAPPAPQGLPHG